MQGKPWTAKYIQLQAGLHLLILQRYLPDNAQLIISSVFIDNWYLKHKLELDQPSAS